MQADLSVDQANQLDMLLSQDFEATQPMSRGGKFSKNGTATLRGLLSYRSSLRQSFDLKNDNISSILSQDDPFLDNDKLLTDRDNLPPTFREHTSSCVQPADSKIHDYFSLTDVNNASSPRKDNSQTNIPVISAIGLFQRSLQVDSPGSDFKLGTFANVLEAKHKVL